MKNSIALLLLALFAFCFRPASAQSEEEDFRRAISYYLEDIEDAKKLIDKYTPEGQLYLVDEKGILWLKRAVSKEKLNAWLNDTKLWTAYPKTPVKEKVLNDAFKGLAESAAKKLPNYFPGNKKIVFHNQKEEDILKTAVSDISEAKIHKIGFSNQNWLIAKDNYNLPISRYKQGYIWVRFGVIDHPYCHLIHVNLIQDYAGGGTYGDSYGKFILSELCGCPK